MNIDIAISGGTIVDGSGSSGFRADLGIRSGRIVEISCESTLRGNVNIDAKNLVVTPGFIDIHTHSDFPLLQNRKAESAIRQGITTSVLGACGRSCVPINDETKELLFKDTVGYDPRVPVTWHGFGEYLSEFEKLGVAQNLAVLVAHNAVRIAVMGYDARKPTQDELEKMKDLVDEAMRAGAIGFSTGLAYPPGSNANTAEVIELASIAAKNGGFYFSHLRGTDGDFLAGVREALQVGAEAQLPVHMAHFCGFFGSSDETQRGLRMIEEARTKGADVTCDLYPYLAGANPLMAFLPTSIFDQSWEELVRKIRSPDEQQKLVKNILTSDIGRFWLTKSETLQRIKLFDITKPENEKLKGMTLADIAVHKNLAPIDAILELLADERDEMFKAGVIVDWMDENDNLTVFEKAYHMVGSDGIALAPYGELASFKFHPRSYGAFPRVIAKYVRELGIISLEEAIRKMTSLPAKRIGLRDRGMIKEDMWADVVIFDYEKIRDTSSYEHPALYPEGISKVILNGEVVIADGEHTGNLPGRVLRHVSHQRE